MRFPLSMAVLIVAVTGFDSGALAQEEKAPLSPLQTQLQKMQDGEGYGMKTINVPQGSATPASLPKETLSDKAKALAEKANEESTKPPSRLELMQDAYKKAPPPADAGKPAASKPAEEKEQDKAAQEKEAAEKAAHQVEQQNEQVMFETINNDNTPKKPDRLIPVN